MLLLALTWLWLPETHPAQARERAGVARLLREYVAIFLNPRFQRLAAASAFNFAALFLFIASAPAYVLEILGLDEGQFGWFFVPMIGGFMLGAWVSGRAAGRSSGRRQATAGFVCSGIRSEEHTSELQSLM